MLKNFFGIKVNYAAYEEKIKNWVDEPNPKELKKYLERHPKHTKHAIEPFKNAKFHEYTNHPENKQNDFLECGLIIAVSVYWNCPKEAWTVWGAKENAETPMVCQSIATMEQSKLISAKSLAEWMLNIAEKNYEGLRTSDLKTGPHSMMFKWLKDQAPQVSANILDHWMSRLQMKVPYGMNQEYLTLLTKSGCIKSTDDALLLLDKRYLNIDWSFRMSTMVEGLPKTTTQNNVLHTLAEISNPQQAHIHIVNALAQLQFKDFPNEDGIYGAQAVLNKLPNTPVAKEVRKLFGVQLPLIEKHIPFNEHPFEIQAQVFDLSGREDIAVMLRLAMRCGTQDSTFKFNNTDCVQSISEYALAKLEPRLLKSALALGDTLTPGCTDRTESLFNKILKDWGRQPLERIELLDILLNYSDKNPIKHAAYQNVIIENMIGLVHEGIDSKAFHHWPIEQNHPIMQNLALQSPEAYQRIVDAISKNTHLNDASFALES